MSEEKRMVELNDEELDKVTGGGHGTIPAAGVYGEPYTTVEEGHYYAKVKNPTGNIDVVWTWRDPWGNIKNSLEYFSVYPKQGDWVSSVKIELYNISEEEIKANFPYKLNVRP